MPSPAKNETENDFLKRCQASGLNRSQCKNKWNESKQKKHMRTIELREHASKPDMEKIRQVAMNPDLSESQVFDFGVFLIARSGLNRNNTDITAEGQRAAVKSWIGTPIYFRDHKVESTNQIGRIYDAWIEERRGETVTYGRGFGVITDDHRDIFARIESGIHREMSCAYEPVKSICSECNSDLIGDRLDACTKGHEVGRNGVYARDVEFVPDHISFVGRPGVEGAGLIAASDQKRLLKVFNDLGDDPEQTIRLLKRDAADGQAYREFVSTEFSKWYGLANPDAEQTEIDELASKLSAREMSSLARIERERFHKVLPSGGKQLSVAAPDEDREVSLPEFQNLRQIFDRGKK
jgi:hypothetical protein